MGSTSTNKKKRTKRPGFLPKAKQRRHELYARQEKERLERVAKNEEKNKAKIEQLAPVVLKEEKQVLKQPAKSSVMIRVRALHKLLRQIQVLDKKKEEGVILNDAQESKLARMDAVMDELEELQNVKEPEEEEETIAE